MNFFSFHEGNPRGIFKHLISIILFLASRSFFKKKEYSLLFYEAQLENLQRTFFDVHCNIEMLGQIGQQDSNILTFVLIFCLWLATGCLVLGTPISSDYIWRDARYVDGRYHKCRM